MGRVSYRVRLYRAHDLDIITYTESHEVSFAKAAYLAMKAFVAGDLFAFALPEKVADLGYRKKKVYVHNLYLDTERDADVIGLLSCVRPGYRNAFIKGIFRQYACMPFSEEFFGADGGAYAAAQVFRAGRRSVDAASLKGRDVRHTRGGATVRAGTPRPAAPAKTGPPARTGGNVQADHPVQPDAGQGDVADFFSALLYG